MRAQRVEEALSRLYTFLAQAFGGCRVWGFCRSVGGPQPRPSASFQHPDRGLCASGRLFSISRHRREGPFRRPPVGCRRSLGRPSRTESIPYEGPELRPELQVNLYFSSAGAAPNPAFLGGSRAVFLIGAGAKAARPDRGPSCVRMDLSVKISCCSCGLCCFMRFMLHFDWTPL